MASGGAPDVAVVVVTYDALPWIERCLESVAPRLLNPDGTLQRSVRGFPTLWRLATEYFFLRKLAPRSRILNGFYAGGFAHDEVYSAEFVMGACMLVRRGAVDEVGDLDE